MVRKTREVAIFVYRGDRFLVTHRANDGHWNVVAGQVEDGESYDDAAARELMEEARLAAPLLDLGARIPYEIEPRYLPLYVPGEHTVTVAAYAVEAPASWEPTLNHEHDDYRWCSLDDALALLHWRETKDGMRLVARRMGIT